MSLQRRLIQWMTIILVVVGLGAALASYLSTKHETDTLLDTQLRQIATYVAEGVIAKATLPAHIEAEDAFLIRVWRADGSLAFSNIDTGLVRTVAQGFQDARGGSEAWRVFVLNQERQSVEVAQRWSAREELAREAAFGAAVPIFASVPVVWAVIYLAIRHLLQRFAMLGNALANRGVNATDPLSASDAPPEMAGLVSAINTLIARHQEAVSKQREFLSDAAHELRTPLAALQIQVGNVVQVSSTTVREQRIAEIANGVGRAARLVDKLLQMARLDERGERSRRYVSLGELLNEIVANHVLVAKEKRIDLGFRNRLTKDEEVEDESAALFGNLIENAIRYTPDGGSVDVDLRRDASGIVVEILDTGVGISPEALPRLFDRFFRAAPPEIEGSGLGLSIAKAIAGQLGWELRIANRVDRTGTTATVVIPVRGMSNPVGQIASDQSLKR